ncbi:MAG: hypothetical protein ACE5JV_02685, partial [Nitrososphaerales archaeon]
VFVTGPFQLGQMQQETGGGTAPQIMQDVALTLNGIEIKEIDEENATIEVAFDALNPNRSTMVLETIQYDLQADGIMLARSSIGERLEGAVVGTGQTYYLVSELTVTLRDTVQIKRTGVFEEIWGGLESNDVQWRITGLYVVTDPVRLGGQEKDFDFTP